MFPMTITIHNSSQLAGVLAAMAADDPAVTKAALLAGINARTSAPQHPVPEANPVGKSNTAAAKPAASARIPSTAEAPAEPVALAKKADSSETVTTQNAGATSAPAATGVSFATARDLVLKLAKEGHRERVQAINAQHGIAKLSALLSNPDDFDSVTDQAKLDAIYADLVAIGG